MANVKGKFLGTKHDLKNGLGSFTIFCGIAIIVIAFVISLNAADYGEKSSRFSLFVSHNLLAFCLVGLVLIIVGVVKRKVSSSLSINGVILCLDVDDERMTLVSVTNDGKTTCEIEFKWHETIIYEQITHIDDYSPPELIRTLQMRLWNEEKQVVLIEKVEDGIFPKYKVFQARELHRADFISLEKGTIAKMSELIEERPVVAEKKKLDLLDRGVYENL